MDEIIRKIINDLDIDDKFITNPETYQVLKYNIRNKLKDIYADCILNEYSVEKALHDEKETNYYPLFQNKQCNKFEDMITMLDVRMIKIFKKKMENKDEWDDVVNKVKSDEEIWGKKTQIQVQKNKVFISYDNPWQRGAVLMYLYSNKEIKVTTIEEKYEKFIQSNLENEKYRFKKRDKYDKNGNLIYTSVKEYEDFKDKELITKKIIGLKKQYFEDVFENLKNKVKNNKNIIMTILLSVTPIESEEKNKIKDDFIR